MWETLSYNARMSIMRKGLLLQALRFGLVGAVNTVITNALYNLLGGVNETLAWVIGYAAGMAFGLFAHARFTFGQKRSPDAKQTLRFVIVNLVSLGASTLFIHTLTNKFGVSRFWAGMAGTAASLAINFIGNRLFVFNTTSR